MTKQNFNEVKNKREKMKLNMHAPIKQVLHALLVQEVHRYEILTYYSIYIYNSPNFHRHIEDAHKALALIPCPSLIYPRACSSIVT